MILFERNPGFQFCRNCLHSPRSKLHIPWSCLGSNGFLVAHRDGPSRTSVDSRDQVDDHWTGPIHEKLY